MPCDRDASKRLTFSASRKTAQAGTGASKPLRVCGPSGFSSNAPPSSRRVDSAITTAARLGQRLQPRRQIGRVADDRLFLRRALSDEIADHDDAGRDADADLQLLLRPRFELRDDGGDVEAGPDRPLGVVLVGARKAEIGQHAVAHEFGDEAVVARDRARTGVLIGANDLAHVLGIEPRRQRGRADEIAEHDRELAALGGVRS